MTKYEPLAEFLGSHTGDSCTLALAEIERIIAKPLPRSARTHPAWWGNDGTHSQARAWMEAGWRARPASPDLDSVIFERKGNTHLRTTLSGPDGATAQVVVRGLDRAVVRTLKRRARDAGRSLEAELRLILTRAARPSRDVLLREADRIRALTPGPLPDSTSLLRAYRDSR